MPARILVIEDNPANLELITYLLRAYGHQPLQAEDGESGLQMVRHELPDLILCDVQLPGINGYDVARQLKAHPAMSQIPLVAVSAYAMVGDRTSILAAGFDGYIAKPIAPETFVSQVEAFLPLHLRAVNQPIPAKSDGKSSPLPPHHATILVVDNLPGNIEVLRAMLDPSGYEVVAATNVGQAMEFAQSSKPDLVLSDVFLAGESGHDLLNAIKTDSELKDIPFLFISSTNWAEQDAAYAVSEGAVAYITRPIEPEVLLRHIEKWLGKS